MEDITDADYIHAKRVCKDFEIKSLGEYHDLYVKIDTLYSADIFENFRKMCLKIHRLDLLKFLSAPQVLLMVEKRIRGGICHLTHQYAKANNKYIKDYDKNKELSYIKYWDVNNLYDWVMLQKLPVNYFGWREDVLSWMKIP